MSLLATHLPDDDHHHPQDVQNEYLDDFDDEEGNFNSYYQDDLEEDDDSYDGVDVGQNLCVVCDARPAYSRGGKSYPTCGLTCANILEQAKADTARQALANARGSPSNRRSGINMMSTTPVARTPSRAPVSQQAPVDGLISSMGNLSVRRRNTNNNTPLASPPSRSPPTWNIPRGPVPRMARVATTGGRGLGMAHAASTSTTTIPNISTPPRQPIIAFQMCVVCITKPCHDTRFVTCGLTCAEKLVTSGPNDRTMCDYCHRRPKVVGKNQCGTTCADKAKLACLLCKARPKLKMYHLCGRSCKQIATKSTPLILEAPEGHITYDQVEKKFLGAWKFPNTTIPTIKKVYKIIENKSFLQPYDAFKKSHGNKEVYRYHGTSKKCNLGAAGNTTLCNISGCALCSILRTSFKISLAKTTGAFGAGVYSSSASNKAYSYTSHGTGAMILTKVVLGSVYNVSAFAEVLAPPAGYDSVVFDRQNGCLNETVVYTDDAIRPVFLIIF